MSAAALLPSRQGPRSGAQPQARPAPLEEPVPRPTMDDVFVGLTGKEIREERASDKERMRNAVQQHGRH